MLRYALSCALLGGGRTSCCKWQNVGSRALIFTLDVPVLEPYHATSFLFDHVINSGHALIILLTRPLTLCPEFVFSVQ